MELSGGRREESVMTDMKKNIKRTAVLSVVLVLMFAITVFGAEQTEEYVPAVYATFWALVPRSGWHLSQKRCTVPCSSVFSWVESCIPVSALRERSPIFLRTE